VGGRRALPAPFDVWVDDLNVYQPDVVVLRRPLPHDAPGVRAPLLVVEVLSPSTAQRDREVKRARLLAAGTDEVWLLDAAAQTIEVHSAAGCRVARGDEVLSSRALPGFALVPSTLFAPPR
jgi:Uma2 family endonuclease